MKLYSGERIAKMIGSQSTLVCEVKVIAQISRLHTRKYSLNPRLDIVNHSPDGFNWGYGGSGPAQLAFAILFDYLEEKEKAIDFYQQFKWDFVAKIEGHLWTITSTQIDSFLKKYQKELK